MTETITSTTGVFARFQIVTPLRPTPRTLPTWVAIELLTATITVISTIISSTSVMPICWKLMNTEAA